MPVIFGVIRRHRCMKQRNWHKISYLQYGNKKQQSAFETLTNHNIIRLLEPFNAVLVSTICVDVDIDNSDLDIICQHHDIQQFKNIVKENFGNYPNFKQWLRKPDLKESVSCFEVDAFEVEIFSSTLPVRSQPAYRHLSMMDRVLQFGGESLRKKVKELKRSGLKTEPSFAKILSLTGDPYLAFLELEKLNDSQLKKIVNKGV